MYGVGDNVAHYMDNWGIITIVNGVKTNFVVVMTTDGTPKGDNTSITTSIGKGVY